MKLRELEAAIAELCMPFTANQEAKNNFYSMLSEKRLSKNEHLLRDGDAVNALYFVRSGLIRYYYLVDGTEHTGQFFDQGMFFTDIFAILNRAPSSINIDALDSSEIIVIPYMALMKAYDADHAFERFGRRMIEQGMIGSQRRTANLLKHNAEERYKQFITSRSDVASRIPQYMIASYLGITPETLSRLLRRPSAD